MPKLTGHIVAFAVIHGIFLSLGEIGPENDFGLLASKSGPTAVCGKYYGAAAAVWKAGTFVGTLAFPQIIDAFLGDSTTAGTLDRLVLGTVSDHAVSV